MQTAATALAAQRKPVAVRSVTSGAAAVTSGTLPADHIAAVSDAATNIAISAAVEGEKDPKVRAFLHAIKDSPDQYLYVAGTSERV